MHQGRHEAYQEKQRKQQKRAKEPPCWNFQKNNSLSLTKNLTNQQIQLDIMLSPM